MSTPALGRMRFVIGFSALLCLALVVLGLRSPLQRNVAFLQLSEAVASKTQAEAAGLAHTAQLSLESLNDRRMVQAIGLSLLVQGNDEQAIELWQRSGMPSQSLLYWAQHDEDQQQAASALEWYQLATRLEPTSSQPWYAMGLFHRRREEWTNVVSAQTAAVQRDANNRDAWYELAWANMTLGNHEQALLALQQAVNADSGSIGLSVIHYYLGHLHQSLLSPQRADIALREYEKAIALDDFRTPYWSQQTLPAFAHYQRGQLLLELGQTAAAILEYELALSLDPASYPAQLALALAKWQQGEHDEAIRLAQQAIELTPKRVNAYHVLAGFYEEAGNVIKARETYGQILKLDPQDKSTTEKLERLKQ